MKFLVCLVALIAVSSAAQIPQPKSVLTELIKTLFNKYKPELANLVVDEILIGENPGEFGSIHNLAFTGLDNISIDQLTAPGPLSLQISNATASLATGSAVGEFDFINIEVPELGIGLNGKGTLSGSADKLWITGVLDCALQGLTFQVKDFRDLALSIGAINAALNGIDNEAETVEVINTQLAAFLGDNLPRIANENKEVILAKINEILAGIGSG